MSEDCLAIYARTDLFHHNNATHVESVDPPHAREKCISGCSALDHPRDESIDKDNEVAVNLVCPVVTG